MYRRFEAKGEGGNMIEKKLLFRRGRRVNKPALIAISMICTVVASCLIAAVSAGPPEKTPVIIGFKEKPDPDLIRTYGGEIKSVYTIIPAIAGRVPRSKVSKLAEEESVEYLEEDLVVRVLNATATWNINKVKAPEVWNTSVSGSGAIVAILDTGVNYCLSDLDTNYLGGYDFYNNDTDPMDDYGHGTMCTAIAVAEGNSMYVGVAPGAYYYAVKAFNSVGLGRVSDIISGIEWATKGNDGIVATDDDADVISMSFGLHTDLESVEDACDSAKAAGVTLVAGSGNDGDNFPLYPARYNSVISVGATDIDGQIPEWSNRKIDLVAPGVDVPTLNMGGAVTSGHGTSMSCPHVSGAVALLVQQNGGNIDPDHARQIVKDGADDLGYNKPTQGSGLLNTLNNYNLL